MTISEKGQGIAIDFLFAILVFLLVLNAAMAMFDKSNVGAMDKALLADLHSRATQTADMLVRTTGQPNDWNYKSIGDVQAIGLAKRDRVIDAGKMEKFAEWANVYGSADYNKCKELLLMGYDYMIKATNPEGIVLYQAPDPIPGSWDSMVAINIKRIANIEGEEAIVEFSIYYPRR